MGFRSFVKFTWTSSNVKNLDVFKDIQREEQVGLDRIRGAKIYTDYCVNLGSRLDARMYQPNIVTPSKITSMESDLVPLPFANLFHERAGVVGRRQVE